MSPKLTIITTCMGRLEHVKVSSRALMDDPRIGKEISWILVDYACPENTGTWATEQYGDRVDVLKVDAPKHTEEEVAKGVVHLFNKPLALNSGAMHAISQGSHYLAFMDADTIITPAFLDYLLSSLSLDNFLIVQPSQKKVDLTGFIAMHSRHFIRVSGYDHSFEGWGAEDMEFRLKLLLKGRLPFAEIPNSLLSSIKHGDDSRTENYEEKDKHKSHDVNLNKLCGNAFAWSKKHLTQVQLGEMGAPIRRLLGIEPWGTKDLL